MKKDDKLDQFGRKYLRKLYSIEPEEIKLTSPLNMMSHTQASFSIGNRSGSFMPNQSSYRGRIGPKGFSMQPNLSDVRQFKVASGLKGALLPFKRNSRETTNNDDLVGVTGERSNN